MSKYENREKLSFLTFSCVFLEAYVVKLSEKTGFWDFFYQSFSKIGENLSFFALNFSSNVTKKSLA